MPRRERERNISWSKRRMAILHHSFGTGQDCPQDVLQLRAMLRNGVQNAKEISRNIFVGLR